MPILPFLLFVLSLWCSASQQATAAPEVPAEPAEYAMRWNVKDGGPKTGRDTLDVLKQQPTDSDNYEVQYFDFSPPKDAPNDFTSILRQRKKGKKKYQLMFKYRGDHALAHWKCPISATPTEIKNEVDISILGPSELRRVYSHSCTRESEKGPVKPPQVLAAQPKSCTNKMTRLKAGTLKVEEWHLPGDVTMVEVSRNASTSQSDLDSFRRDVVDRLLSVGVKPSDRSKTDLGSRCE